MYERITLAQRLKDCRVQATWTLKELAERTGLSVSYLSDLERGRTVPSLNTLSVIAAAYGQSTTGMLHMTVYSRIGGMK